MWLAVFGQVCKRFNWVCHAWCQMDNHYHLQLEPLAKLPSAPLCVCAFPERAQLSAHALPAAHRYSETAWVWRNTAYPKKLDALIRETTPD
jgi:REP element-mobilizing transposase RayT